MTDHENPSFYIATGPHRFRPTSHATGPWSSQACHGGPPSALAMHEILDCSAPGDGEEPKKQISEVHIDLFGEIPLQPLEFTTTVLRPGKRIELVEAIGKLDSGRTAISARAWRMLTEEGRAARVEAPVELPSRGAGSKDPMMASFPYGDSIDWRFVEGGISKKGPATAWATPKIPLIEGVSTTPIESALLVADSANGISAELDFRDFIFIPTSAELQFRSQPLSTTVGLSAVTSINPAGFGTTRGTLFEETGVYAHLLQSIYVEPRRPAGR